MMTQQSISIYCKDDQLRIDIKALADLCGISLSAFIVRLMREHRDKVYKLNRPRKEQDNVSIISSS